MRSVDVSIFAKRVGETDENHDARTRDLDRLFRRVFDNQDGHRLLHLFLMAHNPLKPRFINTSDPVVAAFRDGQADVISTLLLRGTNMGISTPTNDDDKENDE